MASLFIPEGEMSGGKKTLNGSIQRANTNPGSTPVLMGFYSLRVGFFLVPVYMTSKFRLLFSHGSVSLW